MQMKKSSPPPELFFVGLVYAENVVSLPVGTDQEYDQTYFRTGLKAKNRLAGIARGNEKLLDMWHVYRISQEDFKRTRYKLEIPLEMVNRVP